MGNPKPVIMLLLATAVMVLLVGCGGSDTQRISEDERIAKAEVALEFYDRGVA